MDRDDAWHRGSNQLRQTLRSADLLPVAHAIALSALAPSLGAPSGHCPQHRHRGHGASIGLAVDPINAIENDPADEERDT